jgi:hypothetical protein
MDAGVFSGFAFRPVKLPDNSPFTPVGLALGGGPSALEVLVARALNEPRLPTVRSAWKARHGGRPAPLLLVVLHGEKATVCGPAGDDPPAYPGIDIGQAERICREALEQPDRHAALRCLRDALPSIESNLPGIRNEGFLATHELTRGLRQSDGWRHAWNEASDKARSLLANRGEALLRSLGFQIDKLDQVTSVLRAGVDGKKIAVAVLLNQSETPELQAERFGNLSPVSYALAVADRENLPYVMVTQGSKLRLYPVKVGVGVGRRGRTETYVEAHTGLLRDSDAAYLWLLFSAEALVEGGTLDRIIDESKRFAGDLAERLRERIYGEVVPRLAEGLAAARGLKKPTAADLAQTYEMAMTVLFRLLFIAYAEDKDLLPYKHNESYRDRSLKRKATELLRLHHEGTPFDDSDSLWKEIALLFDAVRAGKREWGVPEYDGGLFTTDADVSPVGALIDGVSLSNRIFGEVLKGLLLIETPEGWGPVDFRSLGVREFGTIYEGLLESELSIAETDLTYDETGREKGIYRPCRRGEEPKVKKTRIYLHDKSGARKSSGSYFTKEFAVEHLLDHALEPALTDHLARLDQLDDHRAAEVFFDFRVADIAMGSGHFLVAAVDRIERAFTQYLSKRPLVGVRSELATLRASALNALGPLAETIGTEIEDTQLLRRLIARRCIYGVDINSVSVNLARLSIWIHTFVPGLPLSLLEHNLVPGNSLVGIGRLDEIEHFANAPKPGRKGKAKARTAPKHQMVLADWLDPKRLVGDAVEPLRKLAEITDATMEDLRRARKMLEKAQAAVAPAEALCDIVTACRMAKAPLLLDLEQWDNVKTSIVDSRHHKDAVKKLEALTPLHFPVAFPEVFLRDRAGFDVILGNPPWQEPTIEEHAFWARHFPGLRSMNQREQERAKERLRREHPDLEALYERELVEAETTRVALTTGPYPGMGTGDPDLYKAFCWRFWNLIASQGGWLGVVLPRSVFNAKGSTEFRVAVLNGSDPLGVTMLVNNREWIFPNVHPQYSIGLVGIQRAEPTGTSVRLLGPFASHERFAAGVTRSPAEFTPNDVMAWTDSASLPLLPTEQSLEIFAQLRKSPRLDLNDPRTWRARPQTELHATNDKSLMDLKSHDRPKGFWPVFKGESFDIWDSDTESYYAWADPNVVVPHLHNKTVRGTRLKSSAFSEFESKRFLRPERLPCFFPRIAFRDITNRTNQRTVIAALLPPKVFITNKGPYLLWPRGDERDCAFLLGVLSALSLDWYARRFVETNMNFYILNPFPVPRPDRSDARWSRVVALAGRLASVGDRFAEWAKAVGVECGPIDDDRKFDMLCELDAVVAHLYGLSEKHLAHVFETFHEGWGPGTTANHPTLGDYDERLKTTLRHYRAWRGGGG